MNRKIRLHLVGLAGLALAGCSGPCEKIESINAPARVSGSADFSVYAAMGTSITAGMQSGGLVNRHQVYSFAAQFAKQLGKSVLPDGTGQFSFPAIDQDGFPALLQIASLSPLFITNAGRVTGNPTNIGQATAYHNMGVPGAIIPDAADTSLYYTTTPGRTVFFNYIARRRGSVLAQVASLAPTFITFEYGANEILGPATNGTSIMAISTGTYDFVLTQTLNGLAAALPNAKLAVVNVPDPTTVPFFTTFPPFALDAGDVFAPLIGSESGSAAPLNMTDHVLLTAGDSLAIGTGFPIGTFSYLTGAPGNGRPLPNSMVLSGTETATLQTAVGLMNTSIATQAAAHGAAVVDLHGLLQLASSTGIQFHGATYNSDFITGGLFSLDGVHPNDLAHGVLCNALIDAVNAKFGSTIPTVDLNTVATDNSSHLRLARDEKRAYPWIEHGEELFRGMFPWRGGQP